ncbi:MAG: SPASM domain-containing protein [Candidatus Aminicenantes bacterium]|nr:MAG: SPASM domain-containing protein [Candidatus Aminicenantes bacterium]
MRLIKGAKIAYFDSNRFRYWLHKKIGTKFKPKAFNLPLMVLLEPVFYCNFSCIHCPYSIISNKPEFKKSFMDFDLYKKIIDEISQFNNVTLRPFDRGEALFNPQLSQMIKYAKEKGIKNIWLNTNGSILTSQKSKELLESGLDLLEVSIDAFTEDTFSKIKGVDGKILRKVKKNTIEYFRLKNKLYPDDSTKKLIVSFVESEINTSEKDAFIKFWKNYSDRVRVRPFHQHGRLIKENLRTKKKKKEKVERLPCSILWKRVSIDYCGNLRFCELDWENKGIMGSVKNSSIKEIWTSKEYKRLRRLHTDKRFSEIPLCSICESYNEEGGW